MKETDQRGFYSSEAAGYEATRYGSRYGRLFRLLQREAVARALEDIATPRHVLDVATGTGQMLPVLDSCGAFVVASDFTPAMLVRARQQCARLLNIGYCVADAHCLPYAPGGFDVVTSARFLHLFSPDTQQSLILEMASVLRPGGLLIVDYYSTDARRIFSLPIAAYRALRHKRPENDHRVRLVEARAMLEAAGLQPLRMEGIGNFLLLPWLWLPLPWLVCIAGWLGRHFPTLSEQFVVVARKP